MDMRNSAPNKLRFYVIFRYTKAFAKIDIVLVHKGISNNQCHTEHVL